jgi:D-glycero-D-manno-heptose 1,7-bisphosphate phosphatase
MSVGCYDDRVTDSPTRAFPRNLRTIFLDRDGVLNQKAPEGVYIARWEELLVLPGVPEAIAHLNQAGLLVIVVSNQRGIARGLYTAADVKSMHEHFQELLKAHGARIDAFFVCPHEESECNCRKPLTGMFDQATAQFPAISAATSVMIGDSAADIEFGRRLGMTTIFIEGDPALQKPGTAAAGAAADFCCNSLLEAVDAVLVAH